jgi:abhydrolase domain-containing protein 13
MIKLNHCSLAPVGVGLLYYGQNFLVYPSAFPPGSRNGATLPDIHSPYFLPVAFASLCANGSSASLPLRVWSYHMQHDHSLVLEVPTPSDFSLPYTDLTLTTPDNVKLKCYLLLQRAELNVEGATHIDWDAHDSVDEGEKLSVSN